MTDQTLLLITVHKELLLLLLLLLLRYERIPVAIPLCTSCVKSLLSTGQAGQPAVSVPRFLSSGQKYPVKYSRDSNDIVGTDIGIGNDGVRTVNR